MDYSVLATPRHIHRLRESRNSSALSRVHTVRTRALVMASMQGVRLPNEANFLKSGHTSLVRVTGAFGVLGRVLRAGPQHQVQAEAVRAQVRGQ